MKFSAQEEYGLRCLLQIAREPAGELTIPEIAAREALSTSNVAKLMRVLRQAGMVKSMRGQNGGYQLARPPEQIQLFNLLSALGGRLFGNDFCEHHTGTEGSCVHDVDCSMRSLWLALDTAVERALKGITLRDLLCSEREMGQRVGAYLDASSLEVYLRRTL
ncbi:MAG TPA: Rrf2 family transcriptional regulator [Armatimonadota bacterium]|nr:Rrf2 family transcriptional regulator [Armatimonadota bacterium]